MNRHNFNVHLSSISQHRLWRWLAAGCCGGCSRWCQFFTFVECIFCFHKQSQQYAACSAESEHYLLVSPRSATQLHMKQSQKMRQWCISKPRGKELMSTLTSECSCSYISIPWKQWCRELQRTRHWAIWWRVTKIDVWVFFKEEWVHKCIQIRHRSRRRATEWNADMPWMDEAKSVRLREEV